MGCMNTCTCPTSSHPVSPTLFMHLHTDFRAMIVPHLDMGKRAETAARAKSLSRLWVVGRSQEEV